MTVSNAVPEFDAETTISPEHLSITTRWPSGGRHNIHLLRDSDLDVRIHSGQTADLTGKPLRYDVEQGMVLVLLGLDDDHDEVHVSTAMSSIDMIEALQQTVEVCQRSLDALRKIKACRI